MKWREERCERRGSERLERNLQTLEEPANARENSETIQRDSRLLADDRLHGAHLNAVQT